MICNMELMAFFKKRNNLAPLGGFPWALGRTPIDLMGLCLWKLCRLIFPTQSKSTYLLSFPTKIRMLLVCSVLVSLLFI